MSIDLRRYVGELADRYSPVAIIPPAAPQASPYMPAIIPSFGGGGGGGGCGGRGVQQMVVADAAGAGILRQYDREDRNEERATSASIIGAIATIALAGLAAFTCRTYLKDKKDLQDAQEYRNNGLNQLNDQTRAELTPILNKHIEILEGKNLKNKTVVGLTGILLASGTAAFIGGMMSIQWVITASIITAVGAGAVGAFALVWFYMEDTSLPAPMLQQLNDLRNRI